MHAYATLIVNDHLEQLRLEAAERRAYPGQTPAIVRWIVATATSLKSALSAPAEGFQPTTPTLQGYPYRG